MTAAPATPRQGDRCAWAYCPKWGSLLVEQPHGHRGRERMWVCLTHVVHAEVRGWVMVGPPRSG